MNYVKYTNEKIYVESPESCIARLCKISAEFYYDRAIIMGCTFDQFKEKVEKDLKVKIDKKKAPDWCKI